MKLRNLMLAIGVAGLLAPVSLMAADPETTPAATAAPTEKSVDNTAVPSEGAKETDKAAPKAKSKSSSLCAPSTGSILRQSAKNGCRASTLPMRSFNQDDLQRTGEIDIAQALRKLDPRFY
jgi:hypothetical protein